MHPKLDLFRRQLDDCRSRGHKRALDFVIEAAGILEKAKAVARRDFGRWLTEHARMDWSTADRYMNAAAFVRRNSATLHNIAPLGLCKVYALAKLPEDAAARLLSGKIRLRRPLRDLSDLEFRREMKRLFPKPPHRATAENLFRRARSSLSRAGETLGRLTRLNDRLSPLQRRVLNGLVQAIGRTLRAWAPTAGKAGRTA